MPDVFSVPVNLANPVKGNLPGLPGSIEDEEPAPCALGKSNRWEGDTVNGAFDAIQETKFEVAMAELRIPANAIEQFVDGYHDSVNESPADPSVKSSVKEYSRVGNGWYKLA